MSVASEITRINNNIASAYTAVSNKGGTLPQTQNSANLATAINSISGGGGGSIQIINGIIEQYKASAETISANNFVEFINDTQLVSGTSVYENTSAVAIDINKVFIAHRNGNNLYGIVCTINGTAITTGTDTQLATPIGSTSSYAYQYTSAVLIDTNKVFIAHRNSNYLYGIVCTINGTTITVGADTQLSDVTSSYIYISAALLDTNKVFIAHRNGNDLYGVVCTVDGTTITIGTDTQLATGNSIYQNSFVTQINTNKVFVVHRGGGNSYLYGVVCTVDETTITVGADTQLSTGASAYQNASAKLVSTNKVFVAHRSGSYLYGVVCTIDGTIITTGTDTQLSVGATSYDDASMELIDTNKVFIAHRYDRYLYGVVCTIDGTTITIGTDTQLSSGTVSYDFASAVLADANKVFIAHRNDTYLCGLTCKINGTNIEDLVTITSASTKIDGLLVTQATTSSTGNVWVLNS